MTAITKEIIQHVASLARLKLEPSEMAKMTEDLGSILGYVATLGEIQSEVGEFIPEGSSILKIRADKNSPSLDRESLLALGPETTEDTFVVPKVIED